MKAVDIIDDRVIFELSVSDGAAAQAVAAAATATQQAGNAASSASAASTSASNAADILQEIEDLLPNFPRPAVFALNKRAINDSAQFGQKLKPVNTFLKSVDHLNPSLVMVPSVYEAGKLYSVLPEDGTGDMTVSRNGAATRINKDGLIESVPANVPRFNFDPITGEFLGVLVEPAATNLLLYSEEFSNAYWTKGNFSTISPNVAISPSGLLTADKYVCHNSNAAFALIKLNESVVTSTFYTYSIFLKQSEIRFVQLRNTLNGVLFCNFDLQLGIIGTPSSGLTASIKHVGDGWYKCSITAIATSSNSTSSFGLNIISSLTSVLAPIYNGNGIDGLFVWGAQLETGPTATSYIPTTTERVTRPADIISRTGITDLIGQTEGTILIDYWKILNNFTPRNIISMTDGTTANRIEIWDGLGVGSLGKIVYTAAKNSSFLAPDGRGQTSVSPSGRYKICLTYTLTNFRLFINGVKIRDDNYASALFSTPLSVIGLGNRNGTFPGSGTFNQAYLFKESIPDSQAIQLTTL